MVLVGYDREQHHSFREFDDSEELRYLTLLLPLNSIVKVLCKKCLPYKSAPIFMAKQLNDSAHLKASIHSVKSMPRRLLQLKTI